MTWLAVLTAAGSWGLAAMDAGGSSAGLVVWLLAGYAFYLSLCCTFVPAPTTWIVMLLASDLVAQQLGIVDHRPERLVIVCTIGALATALANLNEYHIFVYLLRKKRVAKVRETGLFNAASGWFHASPFWILTLFSFLPIPIDVIRWLAITARYPRWRFFWANFVGRWFRYAIWAVAAMGLALSARQILLLQAVLVAIALVRVVPRLVRRFRDRRREPSTPDPGVVADVERA